MHVPKLMLTASMASIGISAALTRGINTTGTEVINGSFKVNVPSRAGVALSPADQIRRTLAKYGWDLKVDRADAVHAIAENFHKAVEDTSYIGTVTSTTVATTTAMIKATGSRHFNFNFANSSVTSVSTPGSLSYVHDHAATTTTSGEFEVTAVPVPGVGEYLSPVTIGDQPVNLLFDTGSSDLWVFSTLLSASELVNHSAFDPNRSSTWSEFEGANWTISYGDKSYASGIVGFDHVTIGDVTFSSQAVELANNVSSSFVSDVTDGVVGLGFINVNTIEPTQQKTWFANVQNQLDQPLFTADLNVGNNNSTFEFGAIDNTKFLGKLMYADVDSSSGLWQFESSSYVVNMTTRNCTKCSPSIADTGTTIILLDDDVVEDYYSQVNSTYDSTIPAWIYNCDTVLPDFGVAVGDHILALRGDMLNLGRLNSTSTMCYGYIQGNQGMGMQIFGDGFFKQYFAVFDAGNMTLGVAPKWATLTEE